jgi:hypothetical protein
MVSFLRDATRTLSCGDWLLKDEPSLTYLRAGYAHARGRQLKRRPATTKPAGAGSPHTATARAGGLRKQWATTSVAGETLVKRCKSLQAVSPMPQTGASPGRQVKPENHIQTGHPAIGSRTPPGKARTQDGTHCPVRVPGPSGPEARLRPSSQTSLGQAHGKIHS